MDLAKLSTAAIEHDRQLAIADESLKRAHEAFAQAGERALEVARLTAEDLPSFGDFLSSYAAVQLNQLRGRVRALRRESANFRANVANRIDKTRRARRERF